MCWSNPRPHRTKMTIQSEMIVTMTITRGEVTMTITRGEINISGLFCFLEENKLAQTPTAQACSIWYLHSIQAAITSFGKYTKSHCKLPYCKNPDQTIPTCMWSKVLSNVHSIFIVNISYPLPTQIRQLQNVNHKNTLYPIRNGDLQAFTIQIWIDYVL